MVMPLTNTLSHISIWQTMAHATAMVASVHDVRAARKSPHRPPWPCVIADVHVVRDLNLVIQLHTLPIRVSQRTAINRGVRRQFQHHPTK